ncbi:MULTISPECIES: CcdB family protein [unclassified Endozoicomonas]|uniref:CcdB family protein n=1 Tax=unclassified Endozoicomonas TaxID=2644528 RepID=UPI0021483CF8|nr:MULTISPECIES: CcdB family protein [unclassified Endozoicomonas]
MAQFDVFRNTGDSAEHYPYIVVLQSDLIPSKKSQVVAPLSHSSQFEKMLKVCPLVELESEQWMLIIPHLTSIPSSYLVEKVANIESDRGDILMALDRLFTGIG